MTSVHACDDDDVINPCDNITVGSHSPPNDPPPPPRPLAKQEVANNNNDPKKFSASTDSLERIGGLQSSVVRRRSPGYYGELLLHCILLSLSLQQPIALHDEADHSITLIIVTR